MPANVEKYVQIARQLEAQQVQLVAVSKIQSPQDIKQLYDLGQRDFGENYVQELVEKQEILPKEIQWHFIGHLQRNKVKYIAPFVHLIHGVDSLELLKEINKQAKKNSKIINCLLQIHIAEEETKFGMNEEELGLAIEALTQETSTLSNVFVQGLMGMASFSDNLQKVRGEMKSLKLLFDKYTNIESSNCHFTILSMGMSGDYEMAIEEGSNMVRIGSLLFGARPKK
jgi:pyridoxal phosphate enzyme (YggS family)